MRKFTKIFSILNPRGPGEDRRPTIQKRTMAESSYNGGQEVKGRGQSFNESFNEKLGEFRKFASTSFTRAKQVLKLGGELILITFLNSHCLSTRSTLLRKWVKLRV